MRLDPHRKINVQYIYINLAPKIFGFFFSSQPHRTCGNSAAHKYRTEQPKRDITHSVSGRHKTKISQTLVKANPVCWTPLSNEHTIRTNERTRLWKIDTHINTGIQYRTGRTHRSIYTHKHKQRRKIRAVLYGSVCVVRDRRQGEYMNRCMRNRQLLAYPWCVCVWTHPESTRTKHTIPHTHTHTKSLWNWWFQAQVHVPKDSDDDNARRKRKRRGGWHRVFVYRLL